MVASDESIERELAKLSGHVVSTLGPNEKGHLHFRPDRETTAVFVVEVTASEEVEVVLFHELAAFQEDRRACELGPLSPPAPEPYAHAKGHQFTLHVLGDNPGGEWLVAIENLSGFKTDLLVRAWSEKRSAAA
jgi:hypothetical protein